MAQLTLRVIGDISDVEQKISGLQSTLNQKPIQIKIESSGVDNVTREMVKYATQIAKTRQAEAQLERQRALTATANAKVRQEEARLATQMEKTATAEEQARSANANLSRQIEATNTERQKAVTVERQTELQIQRTATETAKLATEEQRTQTQQARLNVEQQKGENIASRLGNQYDLLTGILRRLRQLGINAVIQGFNEAIQTLKAVDDQLVAVRKVTGFDSTQIEQIKQQAFEVASAYGETADAYLESVAAFSRAGYKEQASDLAELATKTQIVGDTTSEVANQFLISVDAAYKYGGSIEELTKVLDGANEIDNKYATSIEKIASGMGIVAPVAAQMHVTIDELAASIGTITAVTQRSGTEAARALRALFLNIAGDTKTEIDEGVTWTTGEIEGLRDVIKQYAKDAYDAAQATGKVIDPMRAMEGLAKSMADGLLTEEKLVSMVSDIGGKLRTSQLLAIIQNWDMYQSMLQDYAGAIGSADKEVENALDSWTRKTNQLKNEWTELISHFVSSEAVKGMLDVAIKFVDFLDSGVGRIAIFATALAALITVFERIRTAVLLTNTAFLSSPLFMVGVAAAVIAEIVQALGNLETEYDKQKKALEDINAQYDKQFGRGSEYDQLKSKVGELTAEEEKRLAVLEAEAKIMEEQRKQAQFDTLTAWRENTVGKWYGSEDSDLGFIYKEVSQAQKQFEDTRDALADLTYEYQRGQISQDAYKTGLQKLLSSLKESAELLEKSKDAGFKLTTQENLLLIIYNQIADELVEIANGEKDAANATDDHTDATQRAAKSNETLKKAFEEVESKSTLTTGTLERLDKLYPGLSKKILDVNGNLTAEGQAALASKNAFVELIAQAYIFNNTSLDVSGKISALYELASAAGLAGNMLAGIANLGEAETAIDYAMSMGLSREQAEKSVMSGYQQRFIKGLQDQTTITPPPGGTGGGTVETAEEKEKKQQQEHLKGLQQIVADEKARYTLMEAQGATQEELAAQAKAIQDALHNQAEYMREIEEPYASIAALSKEWFDWQKKIEEGAQKAADAEAKAAEAKRKAIEDAHKAELDARKQAVTDAKAEYDLMKAQGASREELAAKAKEIQGLLHDEAEYMRQVNSESGEVVYQYAEIAALSEEWWDWQEKINDSIAEAAAEAERVRQQQVDDAADHVSLLKQQLAFLKASGASDDEIIAKYKEIQAALHEQAETMRAMGADEKDILALSTEWWDIQSQIQGVLDKTAETLKKEIKETIDDIIGQLQEQNDAQVAALQAEIDLMKEQHDAAEDTREEEEKRLAVEKARLALENAQRERTVRQYNASTGQWEWVANAKNVQAAQEELAKSEAALNAYLAEQDYKKKIAELEAQKEETKSVFQTVKDAMNKFADAVAKILESPKLDANAKKKFKDDIEAILTAPTLKQGIKDQFVKTMNALFDDTDIPVQAKADFVSAMNLMLSDEDIPDKAKTQFLQGMSDLFDDKSIPSAAKSAFMTGLNDFFSKDDIPSDTKTSFLEAMGQFFNSSEIPSDEKTKFLNGLSNLFSDTSIPAKTQQAIVDGISTLLKDESLSAAAKNKLVNLLSNLFADDSLKADSKAQLISGLSKLFADSNLKSDAKERIVEKLGAILESKALSTAAKNQIVSSLGALMEQESLQSETKAKIVDGIAALVGNTDNDETAVALFTNYITTAIENAKDPEAAINGLVDKILEGGGKFKSIDELLQNVDDETNKLLLMAQMKTNSMLWWMYDDGDNVYSDEQKALAAENQKIGKALGFTYDSREGQWYKDADKTQPLYTIDQSTKESIKGSLVGGNPEAFEPLFQSLADEIAEALKKVEIKVTVNGSTGSYSKDTSGSGAKNESNSKTETPSASASGSGNSKSASGDSGTEPTKPKDGSSTGAKPARGKTLVRTAYSSSGAVVYYYYSDGTSEGYNVKTGARVFDQGGMLHGMGGIKATTEDEMVIPPTLTKALLNAEKDGAFKALMADLGIVTSAASQVAGYGGAQAPNSIGEQNNGDNYNFGNISLSEQQARGMSVYELAQLGRTLALQRGN